MILLRKFKQNQRTINLKKMSRLLVLDVFKNNNSFFFPSLKLQEPQDKYAL